MECVSIDHERYEIIYDVYYGVYCTTVALVLQPTSRVSSVKPAIQIQQHMLCLFQHHPHCVSTWYKLFVRIGYWGMQSSMIKIYHNRVWRVILLY